MYVDERRRKEEKGRREEEGNREEEGEGRMRIGGGRRESFAGWKCKGLKENKLNMRINFGHLESHENCYIRIFFFVSI